MRHILPPSFTLACLLAPALALSVSTPSLAAETILQLAESTTVMVPPDELTASLRAEATATTPTEAQNRVNAMARDTTALAGKTSAVQLSTGGYQVWRIGPTQQERVEKWQASQSFRLSSKDGAALLSLVGALQQKGLTVGSMQWQLSRETEKKARQDATRQAVRALRGRAEDAAGLLDLKFDHFRTVQLDGVNFAPAPRQMSMARAIPAPPPAAPPSAVAEDMPVSATAQAEAILTSR